VWHRTHASLVYRTCMYFQLTGHGCAQVRAMNYVIDSGMVREMVLTA